MQRHKLNQGQNLDLEPFKNVDLNPKLGLRVACGNVLDGVHSIQKVLSGRRVTIPEGLSDKAGIREGDLVAVDSYEGKDGYGVKILRVDLSLSKR
jgi:hypothetical protein